MSQFRWAGASDTGQVRSVNQDRWYAIDGFFVVADGMGGHRGGEVASAVAVESLQIVADSDTEQPSSRRLVDAVAAANAAVFAEADERPELRGMGTTLCAVAEIEPPEGNSGDWLAVANVGDSRVYLWAGDRLRQITQDHSLVEDLVRDGSITKEAAEVHPQRNILTRALGVSPELAVDYWELPAIGGDRFVLCSDGLFNEVTADQIASVLRRLESPDDVANELVRLANANGGRDNVTVVIADVVRSDDEPAPDSADGVTERVFGDPLVRPADIDIAGSSTAVGAENSSDVGSESETFLSAPLSVADKAAEENNAAIEKRRRRPIRVIGWVLGTAVVVVLAVLAVGLYARSNYYVDTDGDNVVIYQGRPGGLLWFDPKIEQVTDIEVGDLTPALLEEVKGNPDYASFEGARGYVDGLVDRLPENIADE